MMKELLKKLNQAQKDAVKHGSGPLLLVAGAGTGKTTVLINRLAYLILEKKVKTDEILLLTFTEKAAGELEERSDKVLPYGYTDLWINTFHGFGERILRDYALEIGLNPSFRLLNQTDQWLLIRNNFSDFELDYYRPLGNPTKFISELIKHFSRLKDENISVEEYLDYADKFKTREIKAKSPKDGGDGEDYGEEDTSLDEEKRVMELALAYKKYNELLLVEGLMDFGDLIVYLLKLFRERPAILNFFRRQFKYVMVDEFQDTNLAQYELVKLLAAPENNLTVVGDDNQSIYKFRGASLSNILHFKDDYPEAKEIVLNENYRSRQEILDRAYDFIQNNNPNTLEYKLKISKELKASHLDYKKNPSFSPIDFYNFSNQEEEIAFVSAKIAELKEIDKEASFSDFAILVRANDTAMPFVKELSRQEIPNQFMSWRGLYYKPVILDCLAYLRVLNNYHDSVSLFRVLNMEVFSVSHADIIEINKMANRKNWSLFETLENIKLVSNLKKENIDRVNKLLALIKEHSTLISKSSPSRIFLRFAYESGFLKGLDHDRDLEIYSFLNQFYQKIKKLEEGEADLSLQDFLKVMDMELEAGESGSLKLDFLDSDCVKIMTVHGAKGLEFKYVFLVNLVDKKFPTINRSEKISIPDALVKEKALPSGDFHLEEERRLFYVAITRAKERLFLTGAKDYGGTREKKPSRFISELKLKNIIKPEISLSSKNEFLRDLHYLNSRPLEIFREKLPAEKYPLPTRFSFSQLAAFSVCPLQYKFAFILKIPADSDKSSLIFGRVLHNTLYNFLLPTLSGGLAQGELFTQLSSTKNKKNIEVELFSEARLLEIYQEFWQEDGYRSQKDKEDYKKRGRVALKAFWHNYQNEKPVETLLLEKNFSFKIGGDIIRGAIDRVDRLADGTLEIIDYKTGKDKTKLEFKEKRQLILY
ncbi:UvrD-helicase domain-containing protein, partial [Candidatus Falkowbacteria bacterium]|nr:UvrD-helicase domain-containing protein [Candidatus Falkowbacteria bacterium]